MKKQLSLYWELRVLLYLGVLLLSAGLGTWVYQHLDRIDRLAIVGALAAISVAGFYWSARVQPPFSWEKVPSSGPVTDYVLLLACLTFVTLVGYLEFQYHLFGWRLAGLIPCIVLIFSAFYFDHLGVLSLAITNFAAWLGIVVTPLGLLHSGNWANVRMIYTGVLLGIFLLLAGSAALRGRFKTHFAFTYAHFGLHILCIACLAGMIHFWDGRFWAVWLAPMLLAVGGVYKEAPRYPSFYLLIMVILYAYVGLGVAVVHVLMGDDASPYAYILYFLVSAFGLARVFMMLNKDWKTHVRVQA